MRVENYPKLFHTGAGAAQQVPDMQRLASLLNEKAGGHSPLEAARQALMDAKDRLEQQRDVRLENALAGYKALRSRQTSYEEQLGVQQRQLEDFQALSGHRDQLSDELASAQADYEAYAAPETMLDITRQNRLASRVSTLEHELAAADHDIAALVEGANRYAKSQRQYAAYLENTGQGGYAAFLYQDHPECTVESFASETSGMIGRMEAGAKQWRERVYSYCEQYGLTPYDFESYQEERYKLGTACFAAQQRLSELLCAARETVAGNPVRQVESGGDSAAPAKRSFDTMEISDGARGHGRGVNPSLSAVNGTEPDDNK